jgi:hypothetical protein
LLRFVGVATHRAGIFIVLDMDSALILLGAVDQDEGEGTSPSCGPIETPTRLLFGIAFKIPFIENRSDGARTYNPSEAWTLPMRSSDGEDGIKVLVTIIHLGWRSD